MSIVAIFVAESCTAYTRFFYCYAKYRCTRQYGRISNRTGHQNRTDLVFLSFLPTRDQQDAERIITLYFSLSPSPPSTSYSMSPMDIPTSPSLRQQSPSCAFPSWPRRSSLESNQNQEDAPATSFISDDDLFPCVFDDAEQDCSPVATPSASRSPSASSMMVQQFQVVDTAALMKELIAQHQLEMNAQPKKERRRRRSESSRKSRSGSSNKYMSPILEVGE